MKKIVLLFAFFSLLALMLASCAGKKTEEKSTFYTIKDMVGREVSIPKEPKRVVTLGATPVINSFIMALGEQGKIINGLPPFARVPAFKYEYVFAPNIKDGPIIQNNNMSPMVEKLIKIKPDIIFVLQYQTAIANRLAKKGLRVVVLDWKKPSDVTKLMGLLGKIFNKEDQAKEYLAYFDEVIEKSKKIGEKIPEGGKKTVLYTTLQNLSQPHLIAEWWIRTANGKSVTDNGRSIDRYAYSIEQLLAWNPDIILVYSQKDKDELYKDPRFKGLKAVREDKIYISPTGAHLWAHCTIEQPLTVLWALHKFYPNLYSEDELIKDVTSFYERFFKTKLSLDQVREIISGMNK